MTLPRYGRRQSAVCPVCLETFTWRGVVKRINCSPRCRSLSRAIGRSCPVPYRQCLGCGVTFVHRFVGKCAACSYYTPRRPHPITCKQCGVVFTGKWRQLCEPCAEANARQQRRAAKGRRAAVRVGVEGYRARGIWERDGWRCHLCHRPVKRDAKVPHPLAPTIDHLVPISAGGLDTALNVATAHFICNTRRGTKGEVQLRLVA